MGLDPDLHGDVWSTGRGHRDRVVAAKLVKDEAAGPLARVRRDLERLVERAGGDRLSPRDVSARREQFGRNVPVLARELELEPKHLGLFGNLQRECLVTGVMLEAVRADGV